MNRVSQEASLIVVNPRAKGGRAFALFKGVEARIPALLGPCSVVVSRTQDEIRGAIDAALAAGCRRVLAVGGDGTNHCVVNALADAGKLDTVFGSLPLGTGSDWARALGVPADPLKALEWIATATPHPCDLGVITTEDASAGWTQTRRFLNIASAGISGEVDARVNRQARRGGFAFLATTFAVLLRYTPRAIRVECDGRPFFAGKSMLLAAANGRAFGRGMRLAPDALIDDGLLDVILVKGGSRFAFLLALPSVFRGTHLGHRHLTTVKASRVVVESEAGALALDLDGEDRSARRFEISIEPMALRVLLHPETAPIGPRGEIRRG